MPAAVWTLARVSQNHIPKDIAAYNQVFYLKSGWLRATLEIRRCQALVGTTDLSYDLF